MVKMPKGFYDRWISLYPYFSDEVNPDVYEEWTLFFSYFNGVYEKKGTFGGRPLYQERRKFDRTQYHLIVPAEIKYCEEINAWVFTHEHIRRSKNDDEVSVDCFPNFSDSVLYY